MDFCQLLHKAQKNDQNTENRVRYYSTKFEPPKKIKKETKDLSANIKKFLAKKEAEEQKKRDEDRKKRDELLALRAQDKKATRRVNVMLKRTKSANQSVIEDAVDNTHTAVTRAGPDQPDEDDYGYVSQEATALYEKMMEKYSQIPEEPKFDMFKKKVSTNLNSTKDRVKAALEKERLEALQPHKRKRKKKHEDGQEEGEVKDKDSDREASPERKEEVKEKEVPKAKPKPRPAAPPPMSFTELLKIAAQKQHEPILIEEKPREEEKLYTKRQKKELEKETEWREKRERRQNEMENRDREREREERDRAKPSAGKPMLKAPSSVSDSKILERVLTKPTEKTPSTIKDDKDRAPPKQVRFSNSSQKPSSDSFKKSALANSAPSKFGSSNTVPKNQSKPPSSSSSSSKPTLSNGPHKSNIPGKTQEIKPKNSFRPEDGIRKGNGQMASTKFGGKPKEFPPRDLLPKGKPKEFPPRDLKPKQFPPPDVRGVKRKQPVVASKGRIIDDDDDEYDSELDDFIDDGPEEEDYSSEIQKIFGYNKAKYRDMDDDVDDMETSFAQQMKEEVISAKIGIMEDLEELKKEEEEKRRKALMKKKMKR